MLGIVKDSLVVDNKDHIVSDGHMVMLGRLFG